MSDQSTSTIAFMRCAVKGVLDIWLRVARLSRKLHTSLNSFENGVENILVNPFPKPFIVVQKNISDLLMHLFYNSESCRLV